LNHPNICHLYDVGPNYLVMEYVEGESPKGPMPLDEALKIARQIADALEAAHEKGIVHRDLKPANIKVTPDGTVKVLDFGLAKTVGTPASTAEDSPTLTMTAMQAGVIMGTAGYMSPEQARGKPVDKRADIWAFGVVLYELLIGNPLFHGETVSDVLAAVLKTEPDLTRAPARVRPLLASCLEKDSKERLRDIGDMRLLLDRAPAATSPAPFGRSAATAAWAMTAVLATVAAVAFWAPWRKPPIPLSLVKFEILPPEKMVMRKFAVSPNGRMVAFYADRMDGRGGLWVRSLDSLESRQLTEGYADPPSFFWSPDSRSIAYPGGDGLNKLMRVDVSGGPPQQICEVRTFVVGGSWNSEGTILFGSNGIGGIYRVSAAGGSPSAVTTVDRQRGDQVHFSPALLPDGRHFLYLRRSCFL